MTTEHEHGHRPASTGPLARELGDLHRRLGLARQSVPADDGNVLVADLETAYEELRTADEELRAQLELITEITHGAETMRHQQDRLLAALPVPTLSTDQLGLVRVANAAAAGLAGTRVDRLVGKPVLTLFILEDRPGLRTRISDQGRDGGVFRHRARMVDRRGTAIPVDVTAAVATGVEPQVTWVILPEVQGPGGAGADRHLLPEVLVRLTALTTTTRSLEELLTRAAVLSRAALGHDVELSVSLGPVACPDACATTDPVARHLDALQVLHGQGPSLEARRGGGTVTVQDVRVDARWPSLAADVPGTIGAVVAAPISTDAEVVGVLTAYRARTATDPVLVETVEVLAATLAALLDERDLTAELHATASDLQRALSSRTVIDQARGIVMADQACTAAEALDRLAGLAESRDLTVLELARMLVERRGGPVEELT